MDSLNRDTTYTIKAMGLRWGRQIAVAMSEKDEKTFLAFLRASADIQILLPRAKTSEDLYLNEFTPRSQGQTQFFLWNKKFAWQPDYAPTTTGEVYIRDIHRGPVIEYDRDPLTAFSQDIGRLYWGKGLTPDGPYIFKEYRYAYDAQEFNKWYEVVVNWIKANGKTTRRGTLPVYHLPAAWRSTWITRIFQRNTPKS
jgi:hypothetical protein